MAKKAEVLPEIVAPADEAAATEAPKANPALVDCSRMCLRTINALIYECHSQRQREEVAANTTSELKKHIGE